jgi:hypothetical protein
VTPPATFNTSNILGTGEDNKEQSPSSDPNSYESAFPVRPGWVVTIANLPHEFSKAEAVQLSQFIRMISVE